MSAREVENSAGAAAAPTSAPIRNESSSASTTARPTSSHTGPTGSERRRQQASSSSYHQEPQRYSAGIPASYQPLFGGAYDSDQSSTDRDKGQDNNADADTYAVLPDSYPAAYTLKWGPQQACVRTPLDIDDVVASSVAASASGVAVGKSSSRVNFLRRAWQCDVRSTATSASHKLFVLRDTGNEDTNRLLCVALDVDPAFMTAHISGQRYRPRDRLWRGGMGGNTNFSACYYVYPQTLTLTVGKPLPDGDSPRSSESRNRLDGAGPNAQRSAFHGAVGDVNEKVPALVDASVLAAAASKAPGRGPVNNSLIYDLKPKMRSNPVVMFCRGSLWVSPRANVLILDRDPSSTSLEDALLEALDGATGDPNAGQNLSTDGPQLPAAADILDNALSGLVYDQWLDFVDTLSVSNRESSYGRVNRKLLWSMSQYLEQNLTMARQCEKKFQQRQQQREHQQAQEPTQFSAEKVAQFYYNDQQFASSDDWKELLARLERIVALLPLQSRNPLAPVTIGNKTRFIASDTSYTVNCIPAADNGDITIRSAPEIGLGNGTSTPKGGTPPGGIIDPSHRPFSQTPQGQIALSRISYMGGILLPFSIIAGVLSMSDPFGPGDRLFWVFWVITLPITCFTLTIIYADDIRRAYIWRPMSHKSLQDAINRGEAVTASAAARLARAADRVIDKFSGDEDPEIETDRVSSAVRLVDSRDSEGRPARVRVTTTSGPGGPTFYRLAVGKEPNKAESPVVSPVQEQQDPLSGPGAVEKSNVHIPVAIHQARARPRFGILGPLRRVLPGGGFVTGQAESPASSSPSEQTSQGRFADVEPGLLSSPPSGETVVIDVARPNVDSGTADLFSRPPSGINVAAPGCPTILLSTQSTDDLQQVVAWRRQQLGWAGAFKTMVGYHLPKDA
ncbi:hypothetical protein Sste5346_001854 [Sporothrix stenoceras]|uniref:Uncharacterized protein n=1 Tax=Sporothrix stenoceras TaxID=5173 RepID=A0ABR3ZLX0_9PEZI